MRRKGTTAGALRIVIMAALTAAMALGATAAGAQAAGASGAQPLAISIGAFDRMRKTAALPNGISLGYAEIGDPDASPLVLIHGYTENGRVWLPLVPYLDRHLRVVLVDIRGHGLSSKPECCYTRLDFAYDIKLLLDVLGIARADIVGHSLGSVVAQTFAEYWPERTRNLVLISSTGGPRRGNATGPRTVAVPIATLREQVAKLADPIDPDSPFMLWWYAWPAQPDWELVQRQRRDAAAIPAAVWRAVLDQVVPADLEITLPWIRARTLLLWGAKDAIFGADDLSALREALPGARVVIYPDLDHNPYWGDPERVARDINAFLRE